MDSAYANVLRQALTRIAEQKGERTAMRYGYKYEYRHSLFTVELNNGELRVTQDGNTVFYSGIDNTKFTEGAWCKNVLALDRILGAKAHRESVAALHAAEVA